jgi:hypothetical protein
MFQNTVIDHDLVSIPSHYTLNLHVFILHIAYCNHHHLAIERIIHMVSECHPTLDTFLGKRWEIWHNTKKVGGNYCCWLMVPSKGKWTVVYRKISINDYVNGP